MCVVVVLVFLSEPDGLLGRKASASPSFVVCEHVLFVKFKTYNVWLKNTIFIVFLRSEWPRIVFSHLEKASSYYPRGKSAGSAASVANRTNSRDQLSTLLSLMPLRSWLPIGGHLAAETADFGGEYNIAFKDI